jgi:chemotaxis protein CheX
MGSELAEVTARWEERLDRAAEEVFSKMVGVSCAPAEGVPSAEPGTLAAVVGLAGALSGSVVLRAGRGAAERIAERLMGAVADPGTVRDAVGEVCNMIAGAWKGYDPALSSKCLLTTPTLVAGDRYELFSQRAPLRIDRVYRFEEQMFSLTLCCAPPS